MKEAAKRSDEVIGGGEEDKDPLRMERAQGMVRQDAAIGENKQHKLFLFFAMDIFQG